MLPFRQPHHQKRVTQANQNDSGASATVWQWVTWDPRRVLSTTDAFVHAASLLTGNSYLYPTTLFGCDDTLSGGAGHSPRQPTPTADSIRTCSGTADSNATTATAASAASFPTPASHPPSPFPLPFKSPPVSFSSPSLSSHKPSPTPPPNAAAPSTNPDAPGTGSAPGFVASAPVPAVTGCGGGGGARKISLPSAHPCGRLTLQRQRHSEFVRLRAEWQARGVDARCEGLLDAIVSDVFWGRYPLPEGFLSKYEPLRGQVVGSGANGRIFCTRQRKPAGGGPGGRDYPSLAVKITLALMGTAAEVEMLKLCKSPFVVGLRDHFSDQTICISVMELGGTPWTANNPLLVGKPHLAFRERPPSNRINVRDLHACLYAHDRIPIYRVRKLFRGIAEAVEYLHNTVGVFHGDLKLQNILVDADFNVKLVDMSAARKISGGPLDRFFGTPMYGSPEATRGGIFDGCKNDIWSLGIILFMLLTCSDREPVFVNQVPKVPRSIQPDAASVVRSCLSHHPSHRPTIHSLRTHPFIQVPQMQQHAAFPAAMTMTTAVTTRRAAHPASTLSSPGSMMLVARP